MKISLSWMLDHTTKTNLSELGIELENLCNLFNQRVAEVEKFHPWHVDSKHFFAAKVTGIQEAKVDLIIPELKINLTLEPRADAQIDKIFLLEKFDRNFAWAKVSSFGLEKDGFFPALSIKSDELSGNWKEQVEWDDIILEVDNKTITHRPDMWSHRGFAREIALLCHSELKSTESMLCSAPFLKEKNSSKLSNPDGSINLSNKSPEICKLFCAAKFSNVDNGPSIPKMAFRLVRTGVRPINAIVDLTNYLTLDWGQPIHAYDEQKIENGQIVVRQASNTETLELLDGRTINLTSADLIIAGKNGPLGLAGIIGGKNDSISEQTKNIILESANFEATPIRRSAQRHKARTESSARFEKTLHRNLAQESVLRFLKLAENFKIGMTLDGPILSLGKEDENLTIPVTHSFIEGRIGVELSENEVTKPLRQLGFSVEVDQTHEQLFYNIGVPDFRASKDIAIAEDIVEEVARCHGFDKIRPQLPVFEKKPFDFSARTKTILAKNFLANGANMIEQCNYVFYNKDFLEKLEFDPGKTLCVENPVNENTVKLVGSLVPGLLLNLEKNYHLAEKLSFFEFGRIWKFNEKKETEFNEQEVLSGIFWNKRADVNFYECKSVVCKIFEIFGLETNLISWNKLKNPIAPWTHPHATAQINFKSDKIGLAGKVNRQIWPKLDFLTSSDAFFFELDLSFLKNHKKELIKARPMPKVQEQIFDVAFLVEKNKTVDEFIKVLSVADKTVSEVVFLDRFEKEDWTEKKSLAFRVKLQSTDEELSREQVEAITKKAESLISENGGQIRT